MGYAEPDVTDVRIASREAERAPVAIGARLRSESGHRAFAAVIDLTQRGCCFFARETLFAVGQKVALHPESLSPIRGTIKWIKGPLSGMQFENELYVAVFEHLTREHPWRISESAKIALEPYADLPPVLQRELERLMDRVESNYRQPETAMRTRYARPLVVGSRPGLAPRPRDEKLIRLFLG